MHPATVACGRSVAFLTLVFALGGCATTILPPASVQDSVEVMIVDHGRTTSLVIPASEGGWQRYAYGDWNWYALSRKNPYYAMAALLWPTRGALGRAEFDGVDSVEATRANVHSIEALYPVRIERARLREFQHSMDSLYEAGRHSEVENPLVGLRFVPHPRAYTYFWNSNHAVASWLRELGCETRGAPFHARWRVEDQVR